ncbi:MAG: PIN domain-containing protein, partial [Eubacteriales bacterium]|nr:PIN domain-containing protein [Eubacteriales bacterium]
MKRTYLIDSENINDIWVELLQTLEDKDEILVFYTDKSAHMGYDKIVCLMEQKKGSVRWIKCFEGQNALDFQLVTELGSRISQDGKREYVIVSNDTGYDAVVRYWQQKDCRVRRMKSTECGNIMVDEEQSRAAQESGDRSSEKSVDKS